MVYFVGNTRRNDIITPILEANDNIKTINNQDKESFIDVGDTTTATTDITTQIMNNNNINNGSLRRHHSSINMNSSSVLDTDDDTKIHLLRRQDVEVEDEYYKNRQEEEVEEEEDDDEDDEDNEDEIKKNNSILISRNNNRESSSSTIISLSSPITTHNNNNNNNNNSIYVTLAFLTCMIIIFTLIFYFSKNLISFLEMVKELGFIGKLIFVASFIPTGIPLALFSIYIPLTLSSGFVYGFIKGLLVTTIGSALSASFGFWITRKIGMKWLESKIESSPKLSSLRSMVEHHPAKIIIFIRLLPVLPYGIQNGLCAMARISYTTYIYSSLIGLLPENCIIVYVGTTIKTLSDITSGSKNPFTYYQRSLLIIAIVFGIVLSIIGKKVLSSKSLLKPSPSSSNDSSLDNAIGGTNSDDEHHVTIIKNDSELNHSPVGGGGGAVAGGGGGVMGGDQKQMSESSKDFILTIKSTSSSSSPSSSNNIISTTSTSNINNNSSSSISISSPNHSILKSRIKE